jgi:hypothetical protein
MAYEEEKRAVEKVTDECEEEENECADNKDDNDCISCPTHVSDSKTV